MIRPVLILEASSYRLEATYVGAIPRELKVLTWETVMHIDIRALRREGGRSVVEGT